MAFHKYTFAVLALLVWTALLAAAQDPNRLRSDGVGDPHFSGFDGRRFDFNGYPEREAVFSLISNPTLDLNARITPKKQERLMALATDNAAEMNALLQTLAYGSYMTEVGLAYEDASLVVGVTGFGNLTFTINGTEHVLTEDIAHVDFAKNSRLTLQKFDKDIGSAKVMVYLPQFEFAMWSPPSEIMAHIDLQSVLLDARAGKMQGFVGETIPSDVTTVGQRILTPSRYEVPSVLASLSKQPPAADGITELTTEHTTD